MAAATLEPAYVDHPRIAAEAQGECSRWHLLRLRYRGLRVGGQRESSKPRATERDAFPGPSGRRGCGGGHDRS